MTYTVKSADGTVIKDYKTLAAAKKFAEKTEGAVVYCEGEQVYPGTGPIEASQTTAEPVDNPSPDTEEKEKQEEKKEETKMETTHPYKVLIRVNIRRKPSLEADKVGAADVGTILEAYEDLGDWLKIKHKGGIAYARHKNYEYIREV